MKMPADISNWCTEASCQSLAQILVTAEPSVWTFCFRHLLVSHTGNGWELCILSPSTLIQITTHISDASSLTRHVYEVIIFCTHKKPFIKRQFKSIFFSQAFEFKIRFNKFTFFWAPYNTFNLIIMYWKYLQGSSRQQEALLLPPPSPPLPPLAGGAELRWGPPSLDDGDTEEATMPRPSSPASVRPSQPELDPRWVCVLLCDLPPLYKQTMKHQRVFLWNQQDFMSAGSNLIGQSVSADDVMCPIKGPTSCF